MYKRHLQLGYKSVVSMCKALSLNLSTPPQIFVTKDTKRKLIYSHVNTYQSQWNKPISESLNISRQFCPPKLFIRPPTPPLVAFGFVFSILIRLLYF